MRYFYLLMFLIIAHCANAQLIVQPLKTEIVENARISSSQNQTITLPFWDDFSTSIGKLDTTWWTVGSQQQVLIKSGIGIDPPSLGVVTFNGVNVIGQPYLPSPTDGGVDSLVSQYIDLTQVPSNLRNTVYLSFFYQFKGLGEAPEEEDSLILYFKNLDGSWDKMWPTNPGDNYNTDPTAFTQVFTQANNAKYYHSEFQFMFKAFGRQNGWMDNWLVDYVYMNKNRTATDNSYLDRSFTSLPSSIFDQYTAIPFDEFVAAVDKETLFTTTNINIRNLEQFIQSIQYDVTLYNASDSSVIDNVIANKSEVINPFSYNTLIVDPINPSLIDPSLDSIFLSLEYFISDTADTLLLEIDENGDSIYYDNIDLRVNDIAKKQFNLHNYYAYDDGTAEYAAGINQPLGRLAVQFEVVVGKYLNQIDIYFPNAQGVQSGTPLELFVLNDFEGNENSLLLTSNIAISHTGINEFIEFKLPTPIFVTDTFFIGFTSLSSNQEWLAIGLDKNTDSSDKIFVNTDGNWVPNTTVKGSLMMRPHFTSETPILGLEPKSNFGINTYPNPSKGRLIIEGEFNSIRLVDLLGKPVPYRMISNSELQFTVNKSQIIILLVETSTGTYSQRIVVSN